MKKICKHCNTEFSGRSDKSFCSVKCKNEHNYRLRRETTTNDIVKEIDGYLHRNREILAILMPEGNKIKFDRMVLQRTGFRWDYFTGTYLNKEGKTYHLVYDYAWMAFSDMEILLVRKK